MTSDSLRPVPAPSRRTALATVGAAGLAVALTACSSDKGSSDSANSSGANGNSGSTTTSGASSPATSQADAGGTEIAKTSDIPEGGGKIFASQGVVVTQPTAGTYKAFSSKCTHAGCAVTGISNGVISCPCHGSEFSATDGSVKKGPATQPLPAASVKVDGDSIKLA
ncbi:Rieske (2Fe-2S) protein [Streptomyces sp. NPDC005423]|uniref:Rieske (2Fe-2S) protein n=1 Tax=Streptomyces sp. NPDC005423 TaxID=3155343 RepID=UPI0033AC87DD